MDQLYGKILFFVGYLIPVLLIRGPHIKDHKSIPIEIDRKTRKDSTVFAIASAGSLAIPLLYVFTPLFEFADYQIPLWVGIVGIALLISGNWMFYLTHRDLGRQWSPELELREEHQLITSGIYRRIRHPMYTGIFLIMIGLAMVISNVVAGFAGLALFGLLYLIRVRSEEEMMIEQFGDEYRDYMERTGRLMPKF